MPRRIAPSTSVDNLKQEAKRWLKALRAGDRAAGERFAAALPGTPPNRTLRQVQLALAHEFAKPGWKDLTAAVEAARRTSLLHELEANHRAPLVNRFLENACPDHHVRGASDHLRARHTALRLLEQHPWLATATLATRVVCGDIDGVRAALDADPSLINASAPSIRDGAGTQGDLDRDLATKTWAPLLFCCFTRLPLAATNDNAVAMATLLLDRGADPNACFMAGDSRYTPLVGVTGEGEEDRPPHPRRDALAALLLERGAEPYDQQVGYNLGFHGRVLWFLQAVYLRSMALGRAADWADPEWHMLNMGNYGSGARWYLGIAIEHNDVALATWCLEHGASANAAPARAGGARRGTPLYQLAMRGGRHEIAALLRQHGASARDAALTPSERLADAALRGESAVVHQLIADEPALCRDASAMEAVVRANRADAVALLLDAGVSIEVENGDGERPLHIAAWSNALDAAQLLIDRGADVDSIRGNYHNPALGAAGYFRFEPMIDLLAGYSRDLWELVYLGRIDRVRELLRERPDLARSRSNDETPLMWLPVDDESRAIELAELLISLGADAARRNREGRTAADKAERMGMIRLAAALNRAANDGTPDRPTVESYDAMARRLLDAYRTGTPEAMERHYADTWHRREWSGMRSYVVADLGMHHAPDAPFPDITLDDARRWIARDHHFHDWNALVEFVSQLGPDQREVTTSPVGASRDGSGRGERVVARAWDSVMAAIEASGFSTVHANGQMTDDALQRIAALSPVTSLELRGSKQLTDAGIAALAGMPQLRHLDLGGTAITDRGMTVLRHLPQLETLRLGGTRITDVGAAELAHCRGLRRVEMIWTATGDGTIRALAGMPALRHFVSGSDVTDAGLAVLRDIPAYRAWQQGEVSLELTSPDAEPNMLTLRGTFTDRGMESLVGLDGLFGLFIESRNLTARGLIPLTHLLHLGKLSFDAHDDAMPIIARMPALRFLGVQDTDATDDGWTALAASRTIEGIWGRRCHGLGDRGFRALATMPALRNLSVSCRNVSDEALALLPAFPALRELMPMDVPDEGYRHVGRCLNLDSLVLMYCRETTDRATELIAPLPRLRKYFASYTRITDRTPELMSGMASLEQIDFSSCAGLTDAGVAKLARLPRLRELRVSGMPGVTGAVRTAFGAAVRVMVDGTG